MDDARQPVKKATNSRPLNLKVNISKFERAAAQLPSAGPVKGVGQRPESKPWMPKEQFSIISPSNTP